MFILGGCVTDGMIIRAIARYFTKSSPVVLPDDYDEIRSRVTGWVDQPYGNPKKNEILDVYRPKNTEEKLPLILWVHGGAFITGSKEETVPYMVMLADRGFVTATINYQVAPDAQYPTPVLQTAKAYQFLLENAERFGIDPQRIFVGGDSAGAQIAAQFLVAQTSSEYAQRTNLPQVADKKALRGALLFCGPYDITKFDSMGQNTSLSKALEAIARQYLGVKEWRTSQQAQDASVIHHVTSDFPTTFITDGENYSFPEHAYDFATQLNTLGVDVQLVMYPGAGLNHEYQFSMNLPEAQVTFEKLVEFVRT